MSSGHWADIARQWKQVGPPLRPSEEDIRFCRDATRHFRAPRVLILGVTPELYQLPWSPGADVIGADHTQAMIDCVWPGPRDAVVRADWTALPLEASSREIVLCDGGINLLSYPSDHEKLARCLRRLIAPGGLCILRLFVPPKERESPQAVLDDLLAGRVRNLNILKLRLGMALQRDVASGVELAAVWNALHAAAPDFEKLATKLRWPIEHLLSINTYRDCPKRYHFLSEEEVRQFFCDDPGGFEIDAIQFPSYELGERCPTVIFRRIKQR